MLERLLEMIRKEFRQTLRDPRARVVLVMPPIIQLLIFGFAVNLDVDDVRTAWMDADRSAESRTLRAAFEGSRHFRVLYEPKSEQEVGDLIDRARAHLVVRVEKGFSADLARGRTANVQIIVDGTDSNTASIVASYAQRVLAGFAADWMRSQMNARLATAGATADGPVRPSIARIELQSRIWFNPNLKSRDYFIPGVIALVITVTTLILTALAIVREKEIGTMEQLMVTPLRPIELMLGKTLPFALVGVIDVVLITGLALLIFRVPLRGDFLLLLLAAAFYVMTTLGLGLFISTVSHTQQQAMMLSFFFSFPIVLLSGFVFPIANMPEIVQWATYLNPMRYFLEIVRGIFLKGIGPNVLWPQFLALVLLGAAILTFNSLRFHKRLE